MFKQKKLTIAEQINSMARSHPHFKFRRKKSSHGAAVWIGEVQPTPLSRKYTVRVEYNYLKAPRILVISPKLELAEGHNRLPHIYNCGSLCLYTPAKNEWHSGKSIASTIIPWITFWLYYYEIWLITGEWLGDEIDPYHVKSL